MGIHAIFFILAGYVSGSVLFARILGPLLGRGDVTKDSRDGNPGTANAFMYGGFWCGTLTLIGDMAKGFLPVFLFLRLHQPQGQLGLALVIAAPVIGHIFPCFYRFKGGKGIATTFGCLLGLLPDFYPLAALVIPFVVFSAVLRINPHDYRTILTYICAAVLLFFWDFGAGIWTGFVLITIVVLIRMATSHEQREKFQVKLFWKR